MRKNISQADIIIAEANFRTKDKLKEIQTKLTEKCFLILTDIKQLLDINENHHTLILPKNISYTDFVESLSNLIDQGRFADI
ncbi:putative nucleic-acid-binding Zn-ribbon protein [Chryseobacterium defluvii]|uniref:Putative nucleic-acid-binding Zn-ribbon protein n=1 Tax=Chryseobacterium defluvii TaxID=160396 RepID=A0A840KI54_9FLAO|nr:hypothetical protein [Chryseobacterium defluvii]MBB4807364.1 putative nucleic-acid-binding Zn-ribbon protein [Chryseobacterium defluvii]